MSKPPTQQPTDPRIAPKEMIVTRFKSAQQKRQLRDKDRSMTKITQLLKSPPSKTKTARKKAPKSPNGMKKVTEMVVGESREYYPNKLKRKFEEKRTFLRPKYESTMVVKLNKRKLGTPQKGSFSDGLKSPPVIVSNSVTTEWSPEKNNSPVYSELSMEEVVRLVEDTESLDDEDLMEILTCPSPVWWEDPPDEGYVEESLWTSKPEETTKKKELKKPRNTKTSRNEKHKSRRKSKVNKSNKNINDEFKVDKIESRDDKFLKKRSKLENLLGNIKNKVRTSDNTNAKPKTEINNCNETKSIKKEVIDNIENEINNKRQSNTYSESTGSDSFADLSLRDDDMLSNLENMDIPVENPFSSKTEADKHDLKLNNNGLDVNDIVLTENKISNTNTDLELVDISHFEPDDSVNVPKNLPPLTKRPKIDNEPSSPSVRSFEDVSSCETDTISDTNIKFITDDNENTNINITSTDMPTLVKCIKKEPEDKIIETNEVFKAVNEKKDYITVYQIVSNEDRQKNNIFKNIPEYSNHVENLIKQESGKGQLNTFFKKCKSVRRKCKIIDELNIENRNHETSVGEEVCDGCVTKKSITENVKYCLKCSAIFDTEDCSFCSKSDNSEKNDLIAKIKIESIENTEIVSETNKSSKDVH